MLIIMLKIFTKRKDLIRPGITRFAITYLTLSCLKDNNKKKKLCLNDSRFGRNVITCLKTISPLMTVLRLVDYDEKPSMVFIYDGMDCAKEC